MGSHFKASFTGIGQLLVMDEIGAVMGRKAKEVRAAAEATAPIGPADDPHRGRYARSFEDSVDTLVRGRRWPAPRKVGIVRNTAPEALDVEYGNRNTPTHATLRKALDTVR